MDRIGGSVANNDPAADYPAAVLALDGIVETNQRGIAAAEYLTAVFSTALEPGEIIVRISFRTPESAGYDKLCNPASRYALAASFVAHHGDGDARVEITGAGGSGVFRWKDAETALTERFEPDAVRDLRPDPADLLEDMHASKEYRADLLRVMTRRAVENLGGATII